MSDKILKYRFICNFSNHQFPVESISGSSQIAVFMNLRTDLKDQGWWTGSIWSLPPDRFQAGWSVTHFRASYIHGYEYLRALRTDMWIVKLTKISKILWTSTQLSQFDKPTIYQKAQKLKEKRVNTWQSSPEFSPQTTLFFHYKLHPLFMIGDAIGSKDHWYNSGQRHYYIYHSPSINANVASQIPTLFSVSQIFIKPNDLCK